MEQNIQTHFAHAFLPRQMWNPAGCDMLCDLWLVVDMFYVKVCMWETDGLWDRKEMCRRKEKKGKGSMKESCSDLHETGYAHNGLIHLIEDIPPRKCRFMGTRVLGVFRQEAYNILHAPLSPSQLGTEDPSSGIVSKKRLCLEEQRNGN